MVFRTRFPIMPLVSISCLLIFGALVAVEQRSRSSFADPVPSVEQWEKNSLSDPALNTNIPFSSLDGLWQQPVWHVSESRPLAVLLLPSCAECAAGSWFQDWNDLALRHPHVRAIIATQDAVAHVLDLRRFEAAHRRMSVPFVVGQEKPLSDFCNAYFRPRIAVFDAKGKLVYLQPVKQTGDQALKQVDLLLRAL